jgi:hypothetical protein
MMRVQRAASLLAEISSVLASAALVVLGLRAALRLELRWDTFYYHLPFAALRGGLKIPYDLHDKMRAYYEGFPPLPDFVQGVLWRATGSMNATGVVNYAAFLAFVAYCDLVLDAPFWIVTLVSLTAPLVLIHTTVSYVDLFANALLATGVCSCAFLFLHPERRRRLVLACGAAGLAGAAWSKYQLVPLVAVLFVGFAAVVVRDARTRGRVVWTELAALSVAAAIAAMPYAKNFAEHRYPVWPVRVPVLTDLFPYRIDVAEEGLSQRPAALRHLSQPRLFVHSLLEIDHPTRYPDRPRWIIDQGNASISYRMGGFWSVAAVFYLFVSTGLLAAVHRWRGVAVGAAGIALLGFVAVLPQSHELRYDMFIPLCGAAMVAMQADGFRRLDPRATLLLYAAVPLLFLYMVGENRMHYQIARVGYAEAAAYWGADQWWPRLQRDRTYCAVDMAPASFLLTGPTMSEFAIVDRSRPDLCPAETVILTRNGMR